MFNWFETGLWVCHSRYANECWNICMAASAITSDLYIFFFVWDYVPENTVISWEVILTLQINKKQTIFFWGFDIKLINSRQRARQSLLSSVILDRFVASPEVTWVAFMSLLHLRMNVFWINNEHICIKCILWSIGEELSET